LYVQHDRFRRRSSSQEFFNPTERVQIAIERAIQDNVPMLIAALYGLRG